MLAQMFPLEIFPQSSLASSIITTVWVGVFVVAFFNLRFGWVLSGLVVPGYLIPLFLIKPWSAGVVIVEGIVTYFLVWYFSERLSRRGWWASLFGRDRFFALILASIAVRLSFDGWLLPSLGQQLELLGIAFDYRNNLHSFGLVIVALVANQFWKTGVIRGLPPFIVTLGVTYLLIRFVLMEFTNFGLGAVDFMYEDLAASILAAPKAYIILVITAFIASRMNLYYGWEFNGILLPALLALQWYAPSKILLSFVEAFIILGIAIVVLRLPFFARASIEGGNKLLLFFNIGFIYKLGVGFAAETFMPDLKVTDLFAFGYLLSTLLAIKMHDKGIAIRITRATVQTSFVSIVIASILGFALTMLPASTFKEDIGTLADTEIKYSDQTLADRLLESLPVFYRAYLPNETQVPLPAEVTAFTSALEHLQNAPAELSADSLSTAASLFSRAGFKLEVLQNRYLFISERKPEKGWGNYVIDTRAETDLAIEVPVPLEASRLIENAFVVMQSLQARTLAIAGPATLGRSALTDPHTLFNKFHTIMSRHDILQLRAHTASSRRMLSNSPDKAATELWVPHSFPPSLHLSRLLKLVGDYRVRWDTPDFENLQRNSSNSQFAELYLELDARQRLLFAPLLLGTQSELPVVEGDTTIEGYLQEWLLSGKQQVAAKGSNAYVIPKLEELRYFDIEILTPVLQLIRDEYGPDGWSPAALNELPGLISAARVLGYQIWRYRHRSTGQDYLILAEGENGIKRYWGTYVFRLQKDAEPYLIQIPRPLFEINSFEAGIALFERLKGHALIIAGTHPHANDDNASDIIRSDSPASLFNLVNEVLLREFSSTPSLVLQIRAMGQRTGDPIPEADAFLSMYDGTSREEKLRPMSKNLMDTLTNDGWQINIVDGSIETVGYQVGGIPQARYLQATKTMDFGILWLSPLTRSAYRQQNTNQIFSAQFESLSITTQSGNLADYLLAKGLSSTPVPEALRRQLVNYLDTRNIVELAAMLSNWSAWHFERFIDQNTQQSYLLVQQSEQAIALVLNLQPLMNRVAVQVNTPPGKSEIETFIARRATWLEASP